MGLFPWQNNKATLYYFTQNFGTSVQGSWAFGIAFDSFGHIPESELLNHVVIICLIFKNISKPFSTAAIYHFTFPPTVHNVLISPHPHQHLFSGLFASSHPTDVSRTDTKLYCSEPSSRRDFLFSCGDWLADSFLLLIPLEFTLAFK